MNWRTIGMVEPGFTWQPLGAPIVGSSVVRVSHTYAQRPNGPALIRMNYASGYFNTRSFYPTLDKRIVEMRIPSILAAQGVLTWQPAIRLGYRTRPHENDNWQVLVEELTDVNPAFADLDVGRSIDEILNDLVRIEQKLAQQGTNNPALTDQIPTTNVDNP